MVIRCEAIDNFTLERYDELRNIINKSQSKKGHIQKGDIFECDLELAEYLLGKNDKGKTVIRIIEYKPESK